MKTIAEVRDSIVKGVLMERNMGDIQIDQILREYAESIVDECAGNFECTMEEGEEAIDIITTNGEMVRTNYNPVLMRSNIEAVKSMIK